MADKKNLIEFPCHFPVKIIGQNTPSFLNDIYQIVSKHFPELDKDKAIDHARSKNDNYLSLTVTVYVLDQAMLDAFYSEASAHPEVKMML